MRLSFYFFLAGTTSERLAVFITPSILQLHKLDSWQRSYWRAICSASCWVWIGALSTRTSCFYYRLLVNFDGEFNIGFEEVLLEINCDIYVELQPKCLLWKHRRLVIDGSVGWIEFLITFCD